MLRLPRFALQSAAFVLSLSGIIAVALWLLFRVIVGSDPDLLSNVVVALVLLFVVGGSLTALLSWSITRRVTRADYFAMSLRHGMWGGAVIVALPVLRWIDVLSPLLVCAVLMIVGGVESLILLQGEPDNAGDEENQTVKVKKSVGADTVAESDIVDETVAVAEAGIVDEADHIIEQEIAD